MYTVVHGARFASTDGGSWNELGTTRTRASTQSRRDLGDVVVAHESRDASARREADNAGRFPAHTAGVEASTAVGLDFIPSSLKSNR